MTTIQGGITVTRTIAQIGKVTTSALSQTTKKLTNQTGMGHLAKVTVHPSSGPSSSSSDKSFPIIIGSSMAGLVVFGIASLVVYRLVCIGKKINPTAAR